MGQLNHFNPVFLVLAFSVFILFLISGCVSPPVCGDEICQFTENSITCPADCGITQTHAECINQQCKKVVGAGKNECSADANCIVPSQFHSACVNQQCAQVVGAGPNMCESDLNCNNAQLTCAQLSGSICENALVCPGTLLLATDSNFCCSTACNQLVEQTCSELNGYICDLNQTCQSSWLDANDTLQCCETKCAAPAICGDGTCQSSEDANSCLIDCQKVLCHSDSDGGLNTIKKGQPYLQVDLNNGNWDRVYVGQEDSCIDANMLIEGTCQWNWEDGNNVVKYSNYTCPNGCLNGGCLLGADENFCDGANCVTIDQNFDCWSQNYFETTPNPMIKSAITLRNEATYFSTMYYSRCINQQTVKTFYCQSVTQGDNFKVPRSINLTCPNGYSCNDGACQENDLNISPLVGDLSQNGVRDANDVNLLRTKVNLANYEYDPKGDLDGDGFLDLYDLYLLDQNVSNNMPLWQKSQVRNFSIVATNPIRTTTDNIKDPFIEYTSGIVYDWFTQHKQVGNSRMQCSPPVLTMNISKFKVGGVYVDVKKTTRLPGYSSYPLSVGSTLKYDEFKMVPDCDIWHTNELGNLPRESFIYWLFRKHGVPTMDILTFADLNINAPDFDSNAKTNYMILQKLKGQNDNVPFSEQFGYDQVLEGSDVPYSERLPSSNRFYNIDRNVNGVVTSMLLDKNIAIKYFLLTAFTNLQDRSDFWNEYYGHNVLTGKWEQIPYDFDLSFDCYFSDPNLFSNINSIPPELRNEYKQTYYQIARYIFDNPNNLYDMLSYIDKFPFSTNKIRFKEFIKTQFYYYALYFGREDFATQTGEPYVPFTNTDLYKTQARHILADSNISMLCDHVRGKEILAQFLD